MNASDIPVLLAWLGSGAADRRERGVSDARYSWGFGPRRLFGKLAGRYALTTPTCDVTHGYLWLLQAWTTIGPVRCGRIGWRACSYWS
ncbi:hypothetical protein SY2F82_42570 [Streptomyces sp. Y2F8-2]|nr:hypothetical protein SY2F82_42570 [Streptomyces sp. Y2F8-2]